MTARLSASVLQHPSHHVLLAYRWGSLLPAVWLLATAAERRSPALLLAVAAGTTLLITLGYAYLGRPFLEQPLVLGADVLGAVGLLLLSNPSHSPYVLYALSPLLAGAFFFHSRGGLGAAAGFTALYGAILLIAQARFALIIDWGQIMVQVTGAWLVTGLVGVLTRLWQREQRSQMELAEAHQHLVEQQAELAGFYRQLQVIHELTLFLRDASDSQAVQQQLLKAVTGELAFVRAAVALVNPALQRLEAWQAQPQPAQIPTPPLHLEPENGLIAQAALDQQVRWCSAGQALARDETLTAWLGEANWLILPLVWETQTVGVLLVAVEAIGPVSMSDDRWVILTSLVSQAAVVLGTLNRTRRLAVERERNRIARDIHDTVAQSLFGIVFSLDACAKMLPDQVEIVQQELVDLRHLADQVRHEVRQSILDIWPSELTQEKFKADLSQYVTHYSPDHVFCVDFTIEGDFDGLPALVRRTLYRVCQEALANAARHAGVDTARVTLHVEPEAVSLSVRDKGRGFEPRLALTRERNRERFGLQGMRERTDALHGSCDILSQAGQGTQVLIRVPLDRRNGRG
ncbi:MAG TPA: GAF domain-containing sensor histidine kinase [Anaerolineae bacterium]